MPAIKNRFTVEKNYFSEDGAKMPNQECSSTDCPSTSVSSSFANSSGRSSLSSEVASTISKRLLNVNNSKQCKGSNGNCPENGYDNQAFQLEEDETDSVTESETVDDSNVSECGKTIIPTNKSTLELKMSNPVYSQSIPFESTSQKVKQSEYQKHLDYNGDKSNSSMPRQHNLPSSIELPYLFAKMKKKKVRKHIFTAGLNTRRTSLYERSALDDSRRGSLSSTYTNYMAYRHPSRHSSTNNLHPYGRPRTRKSYEQFLRKSFLQTMNNEIYLQPRSSTYSDGNSNSVNSSGYNSSFATYIPRDEVPYYNNNWNRNRFEDIINDDMNQDSFNRKQYYRSNLTIPKYISTPRIIKLKNQSLVDIPSTYQNVNNTIRPEHYPSKPSNNLYNYEDTRSKFHSDFECENANNRRRYSCGRNSNFCKNSNNRKSYHRLYHPSRSRQSSTSR